MNALLLGLLATVGILPDVDKNDIRKLLAAGISETTIVEFIQKNGPAEPLSIDDITELKKAGAGDAVLNAMLQASRTSDAVTRTQDRPPTVVYSYPSSSYYPYSYYPYSNYSYYPYSYRYPYSYAYRSYPRYHHYPYSSYSYRHQAYPHRGYTVPYNRGYTVPRTTPPRTGVDRYRR